MFTYTNKLRQLILPEYGRNIQNMVDVACSIDDHNLRTSAAYTIIATMKTLFPTTGDASEYTHKIWDHLMLMSDYKLMDIDLPFEMSIPSELSEAPQRISTAQPSEMISRKYGLYVSRLIDTIIEMPEGEDRNALIFLLANHMKKLALATNKDGAEDVRIFEDLYNMSGGKIEIYPDMMKLHDYKIAPTAGKKKKKK